MKRRDFLKYISYGCCGTMMSCSTAPITNRNQVTFFPESVINSQAASAYAAFKKKAKLSEDKETLKLIEDIGSKMKIAISAYFSNKKLKDPTKDYNWEYILVDDDKTLNAWCMPGGKIAVYTGILKVTKNKDGLANVMGHEIAHAVAKHSVERASRGILLNTSTQLIDIFSGGKLSGVNRITGMNTVGLLSQIGIMNPFSRKQESEADYLGMIFSSLSGYDIRETKKLWVRMKKSNKGKEPAEFMSTHPSSTNRIKNLNEWENEVILEYPPMKII